MTRFFFLLFVEVLLNRIKHAERCWIENLMIQFLFLNLLKLWEVKTKIIILPQVQITGEKKMLILYIFFLREIKSTKKDRKDGNKVREMSWRRLLFVRQQKRQWMKKWMKKEWERKIRIKWKLCRSASEQKAKPYNIFFCFVRFSSILVVVNIQTTLWMNS